jgi:hypothetical protein
LEVTVIYLACVYFLLKLREKNDNEIQRTESVAGAAGILTIIFTSET